MELFAILERCMAILLSSYSHNLYHTGPSGSHRLFSILQMIELIGRTVPPPNLSLAQKLSLIHYTDKFTRADTGGISPLIFCPPGDSSTYFNNAGNSIRHIYYLPAGESYAIQHATSATIFLFSALCTIDIEKNHEQQPPLHDAASELAATGRARGCRSSDCTN